MTTVFAAVPVSIVPPRAAVAQRHHTGSHAVRAHPSSVDYVGFRRYVVIPPARCAPGIVTVGRSRRTHSPALARCGCMQYFPERLGPPQLAGYSAYPQLVVLMRRGSCVDNEMCLGGRHNGGRLLACHPSKHIPPAVSAAPLTTSVVFKVSGL